MLWAWERPEDLRFIDPQNTAVAFLADTIRFTGSMSIVRPRLQRLVFPMDTKLVAVVRIEPDWDAEFGHSQIKHAVAAILSQASLPRVAAVQVDFDATRSQRAFYRALLLELRRKATA